MILNIHHDCDGVLRDFYPYALEFFLKRYPKFKKYVLPINKTTGWTFKGNFQNKKVGLQAEKIMEKLFFKNPKTSYQVFRNPKALISPDEWKKHVNILRKKYPECRIVISTHQYSSAAKLATIEWLDEHKIIYDDLIFTDQKHFFDGHFLLDDKVETIKKFHLPHDNKIGVLFFNQRSNGWYFKDGSYQGQFPVAKTLKNFREIINLNY